MPILAEKYKEPVAGVVGAGVGLSLSEFAAEFTTKGTGLMGWRKAVVKTLVKGVIGGVFLGLSRKVPALSVAGKIAAFCGWGSVIPDWIAVAYPGGIPGLAEAASATVRVWAVGAKAVAAEMKAAQVAPPSAGAPAVTAPQIR